MKKLLLPLLALLFAIQISLNAQSQYPLYDSNNIAQFKPTKQSNVYDVCGSARAVDGNKDGNWHGASLMSTHSVANPYWEVNLLDEYAINRITIYNRTDCCPERFNNFTIRVSKTPFRSPNDGVVFNPNNSKWFTDNKTFTGNAKGQYVRIQINGNAFLTLAEVVINGSLVNPERVIGSNDNLALGKLSRQSSTGHHSPAHLANDGNDDGDWKNGSVSHANSQRKPFWEVDLGKPFLIREVKIHNRTDFAGDRLDNFHIFVTNRPKDEITGQLKYFAKNVDNFTEEFGANRSFNGNQIGRYIRVELEGTSTLNLAEVEVFGDEVGEFEVGQESPTTLYKLTKYENIGTQETSLSSRYTKTISEGMDFSRTVSKEDKHHWSIEASASTTVDYLLQEYEISLTVGAGGEYTNNQTNSQASSYAESRSEEQEISQKVPGGYTRYEIREYTLSEKPITYRFKGKTYSWHHVSRGGAPTGNITTMVFPNNKDPEFNESQENWVTRENFERVKRAHPHYNIDDPEFANYVGGGATNTTANTTNNNTTTTNTNTTNTTNNNNTTATATNTATTVNNNASATVANTSTNDASNMAPASAGFVRIQNKGNNANYIHNQNGKIEQGKILPNWWSAQWKIVPADGGYVRIQNKWKPDQYLHNQNGKIEASKMQPNWWSAQWKIISDKDGWVRIQNKWKPTHYLHNQNGKIEVGPIDKNSASALWKLK